MRAKCAWVAGAPAFAILDIASGFEGMGEECNGVLGTNWKPDDVVKIGSELA